VGKHVGGKLNGELLRVIGDSARIRIVSVRDRHRGRIPNQLREIESRPTGVGARNKDTAHGIAHARPFAALPSPEVAWIFLQQAGKNRLRHHVPDGLISACARVALGISLQTLPEGWILILELVKARERAGSEVHRPVERVLIGDCKFSLGRNRLEGPRSIGRPVVRQNAEDSLVGSGGRVGGRVLPSRQSDYETRSYDTNDTAPHWPFDDSPRSKVSTIQAASSRLIEDPPWQGASARPCPARRPLSANGQLVFHGGISAATIQ